MPDAPTPTGPLSRSLRIAAIAFAALLLTSTFVYLGFPYDRLAAIAAEQIEGSTGYRIVHGPVAASPGLLGPGIAVEDLSAIAPNGDRWEFSRIRVRPAWSLAWFSASPAISVDAQADFGHVIGVTTVLSTPAFDGEVTGVDLTRLLAEVLPRGAQLTGDADIVADVTMGSDGAEGPISISLRDGTLSHSGLPIDVPYEQIDAELRLGGELTAEILSLTIRSPLGSGNVAGTVGRAAAMGSAPLDLRIEIAASEDIHSLLKAQGVRLGKDGQISLKVGGTVGSPRAVRQ